MGLRLGATIVDEIDGTFVTPPPSKSRMGKWLVLAFTVFILDLGRGGGGGVGRREGAEDEGSVFHFILSKMVV